MTSADSLTLLLTLPPARLCQMLCFFSRQHNVEAAWGCLLWVETERYKRSTLSHYTAARWKQSLFPALSLERLLNLEAFFNPMVLDLVTESVLAPLLTGEEEPDTKALSATWESWQPLSEQCILTNFLETFPRSVERNLLNLSGSEFLRAQSEHVPAYARTAALFQLLLYLFHEGDLSEAMLVNLSCSEKKYPLPDWQRLLNGLQTFHSILQTRPRQ